MASTSGGRRVCRTGRPGGDSTEESVRLLGRCYANAAILEAAIPRRRLGSASAWSASAGMRRTDAESSHPLPAQGHRTQRGGTGTTRPVSRRAPVHSGRSVTAVPPRVAEALAFGLRRTDSCGPIGLSFRFLVSAPDDLVPTARCRLPGRLSITSCPGRASSSAASETQRG